MMENNKNRRIIDLGILPENELSGVSMIALVEEPAIEVNFQYFNKQNFVKPAGGESKDDFISRCIGTVVSEGKDADQAAAICYSYWDESFDIDTSSLTPYVDPGVHKKNIEDILIPAILETILELASVLGISQDDVKMVSHNFADIPKDAKTLYKYEGRLRSTSRRFCTRLMGLNRFYLKEEIEAMDSMNEEFGPGVGGGQYSIFKYKGGANCAHYWQKYIGFYNEKGNWTVVDAIPSSKEERTAAEAPRTTVGRGFVKRPQRSLSPLSLSKMMFADEEQKIVVGPAMIPNMEILRKDENGKPYYVRFSCDTIKEIAMKYMKEARTNEINQDHNDSNSAGTYIFETWIIEDPETDKANTIYGYNLPECTWMCKMKVEDQEVWKRIKSGELKGFSVEGAFADMEEIQAQRDYLKIKKILGN